MIDNRAERADQRRPPRFVNRSVRFDRSGHCHDHIRALGDLDAHVDEHTGRIVHVAAVAGAVVSQTPQRVLDCYVHTARQSLPDVSHLRTHRRHRHDPTCKRSIAWIVRMSRTW